MKVTVCEGVTLSNPIGDHRDYHGGDVLEIPDGRAANWIRKGWVQQYVEPDPVASGRKYGGSRYR